MCSIFGGTKVDDKALEIFHKSKDRGRDFTGLCAKGDYWIANHRATPTNEKEDPIENQPFGTAFKVVHNGTIANDKDFALGQGHIDSKVLEVVLEVDTVHTVAQSLQKVVGSYAIAILTEGRIILACNYKPIWWVEVEGQRYFSSLKHHLPGYPQKVEPYSVLDLVTLETAEIPRQQAQAALVIHSGGLDSTAVAAYASSKWGQVRLLHFDYGCKATSKEALAVKEIAHHLGVEYDIVPIDYSRFKGESTLLGEEDIDSGKKGAEYALDWVYARNLVMLSIATAYAEANGFGYLLLGTNLEESGAYPDNEEQFILDFNSLLYGAVNNGVKVEVVTPLGGLMKREIVLFSERYNAPQHLSWSCYNNGEHHCGKCVACYMRKKAYKRAGVKDPTKYEQ